ncbi:FMR1-interacting protein NUFIP1 [Patella vulgata]|uniref:FMR1-interacting protein NUFIP1 n=1 Tax=Patella vulgata TaxID=6465 RepID=UPI0024A85715|nr:FMR1-interacting protein NUFIP1 [Patella vulgata]
MNNLPNPFSRPPNFFNGQQGIMNPTNPGFGSGQPQQMNFYNHPMNMNGFNNNNGSMPGRMPFPNNQFNPQSFRNNGFRGNRPVNNVWSSQSPQLLQPQFPQQQNCHQAQGNFSRHLSPGQFDPSRNQFENKRFNKNRGQFDPYQNRPFNTQNKGPQQNYQNKKNKKNKVQVDKRDLAENNMFYCDICDRGFKQEDVYTKHVGEHEQCKVDGCPYVAAPKLVRLHFDLQHRTGFAKKIWCTESKEELDAWINERKRKYPTASNILKKKMILEEKQSRGELLETKQFGKMRDRKKNRGRNRDNNFKRKAEDGGEKETDDKKIKTSPKKDIKDTDPLGMLIQCKSSDTSDPEGEDSMVCEPTNALAAILTCYADSDDCKTDTEKDNITKVADTKKTEMEAENIEINDDKYHRKNKDVETNDNNNNKAKVVKNKQNIKQNDGHFAKDNPYNKPSLLEMLLAKEIRHERNVILQCVHYIVTKNFFSKEDNKIQNSDTP